MDTQPEFDLGLPPPPHPRERIPDKVPPMRWKKYTAVNRNFCDICLKETETINGIPVHVVNRATHTEEGPLGRLFLCSLHMTDRKAAHAAANPVRGKKPRSKG